VLCLVPKVFSLKPCLEFSRKETNCIAGHCECNCGLQTASSKANHLPIPRTTFLPLCSVWLNTWKCHWDGQKYMKLQYTKLAFIKLQSNGM
jgi:hypothetical protein